ncbi:acyltransferase family protein [Burkholderia territorii]|uniref:acyltransferase family protein n=1 Tax=Burkholderia territorii TaxID=1503055 RepID=UPI0009BE5F68|nr:acyltransferase [Burkholderia territorii]
MAAVSEHRVEISRVAELNGLRGIAILAVVWHHLSFVLVPAPPSLFGMPTEAILWNGWMGVNLFFILSGFVLYLPYAADKRRFTRREEIVHFYRHRFLRLMPLYFFVVVATFALSGQFANANEHAIHEIVRCLTFTFPFFPDTFSPSSNWALWSVGAEVMFSLIFPLLVAIAERVGLTRLLGLTIFLSLCVRLLRRIYYPVFFGPDWVIDALLIGRLDEFVIGMWLARSYVDGRWLSGCRILPLAATALLAVASWGFAGCFDKRIPAEWTALLNNVLDIALALFVVTALSHGSLFARLLRSRLLQVLGMGCYSVYLWHLPILRALQIDVGGAGAVRIACFIGATVFLSAMTYRFVEFRSVDSWRQLFLAEPPMDRTRSMVNGARG